MKKVLLSAIFALFITTLSFASSAVVKPAAKKQVIKKEVVTKVVKADNLTAADIEKIKQDVRNSADWLCVVLIFEDGSWLAICCEAPCAIVIEFEQNQ